MRRAALVAIVAVGVGTVVLAGSLMAAKWGSLRVRQEVDPLAVLNVGILLLVPVALGEYLKQTLSRTEAEHRILIQEIGAARSFVTSALNAFLVLAASPEAAGESFRKLNLEFKVLSQAVAALELLLVPEYCAEKQLYDLFLQFKRACTSVVRPTEEHQMLAIAKRAVLDQALATLAIRVARHRC